MGHIRLSRLPRTRAWKDVVELVAHGATAQQVAAASVRAADEGLRQAARDCGTVTTVQLLLQLPHAARFESFADGLATNGVSVAAEPTFMDVLAAVSAAIDATMPNNRGRTDLGEMAQSAAAETLAAAVGRETQSLFGASPAEVQAAFARMTTVKQFGLFARMFFARFTFKVLDYFLSRMLVDHVGNGLRFTTLERQAEFSQAMELHCREAARYVEAFSGQWASRERFEAGGQIPRERVVVFIGGAMAKLVKELKRG